MSDLYDIPLTTLIGEATSLRAFEGKVLLIVNVASKCGFTPQYEGLEALQRRFGPAGFSVIGVPCDQFGGQEPGSAEEIATFCSLTYGVSFPMLAKAEVNGPAAHPLYRLLKSTVPGVLGTEAIKWNFTKFLIDRSGRVVSRHAPQVAPEQLVGAIEKLMVSA
ncbi:MAG: glutathione peroxidase [Ancalomicrobiaceae bacterium]|nr:glutathione peroxidase [Ancalomicrobiaceae bacterium]